MTDGSITVGSYVYDGQGRRVKKTAGGQTTYYLYDQQDRLIAEINQSGQLKTGYAHLPDRPLIKVDVNGGAIKVYYYHTDHHGTPLFMTDTSGQKVWSAVLLPFGESYNVNEDVDGNGIPVVNNLRFPGQYYDAETGLHYNMMRDYNPQIGRYIESDPIGLEGGDNTYVYVGNSPVNRIDPLGLYWKYSQSTGQLTYVNNQTGATTPVGTGYAGYAAGLNNPNMQNIPNIGPIPQGTYNIGDQQTSVTNSGRLLPGSMRLTPQHGTNTFNRGGFLIHGGNFSTRNSYRGCIVAPLDIRNQIGNNNDNILRVIP